ncbi:MAG: hypothetical protein ACW98U_11780 [Candidatus Thorarchaeota archaeon]
MSYYQDVKDPNIPIEEVRTRLEKVCGILDTIVPETIVYEKEMGSFRSPRLLDNGRTIVLFKSQGDSSLNWQICNLYHSLVARKSSRWMIRHFESVMLLFVLIGGGSVLAPLYLSAAGLLTISVTLAFLILQVPYVGVGWFWRKAGKDRMMLWKETMNDAGIWPDTLGSNYVKLFKRMFWMPFLVAMVVVYSFLMYGF